MWPCWRKYATPGRLSGFKRAFQVSFLSVQDVNSQLLLQLPVATLCTLPPRTLALWNCKPQINPSFCTLTLATVFYHSNRKLMSMWGSRNRGVPRAAGWETGTGGSSEPLAGLFYRSSETWCRPLTSIHVHTFIYMYPAPKYTESEYNLSPELFRTVATVSTRV